MVRAPNFLGDHILALPFYSALRAQYPQSTLTLLGPDFVENFLEPEWRYAYRPLLLPDRKRIPTARLAERLARDRYDLAITLVASFSSAWLLWRAKVPHRMGFAESAALPFLTHAVRWRGRLAGRHKSELYLSLLEEIGSPARLPAPPALLPNAGRTIVIAPGASLPLREWPYFLELILWLRRNYPGLPLSVVGGPGESVWHKRLSRLNDSGVEDLVGRTSLEDLTRIMQGAALVIANDSGPAHLAATVARVPTFVLFGPGDPLYVAPRGTRVTVARRTDLPCSPCESAVCRNLEKKACLNGLSLEQVVQALDLMGLGGKNSALN